jgi:chemotaxis protein MotB
MSKKGGSHGGAWKVAYADFVTSMMALFLVLWVVAMSQEAKMSFAGFFRASAMMRTKQLQGVGTLAPISKVSRKVGEIVPPEEPSSTGEPGGRVFVTKPHGRVTIPMVATMQDVSSAIQTNLRTNNEELSGEEYFRYEFFNDGFRIQAMDRTKRPLFEKGTANLTDYGHWVLRTIAWEVERHPFRIEVEGHTQGGDPSTENAKDPWELSTNRALMAQQCMVENGVQASQFWRVAGYADRLPLDSEKPGVEINRRITVIVRLDPDKDTEEVRRNFSTP